MPNAQCPMPNAQCPMPLNRFLLLLSLLLSLMSCVGPEAGKQDSEPEREIEKTLTFTDATLEQVNESGQTLWKVRSPTAHYNDKKKITFAQTPDGELFQDGQLIYRIKAKNGQVYDNGEKILLQEDIVATDLQSGAVLRGEELEWLPEQDLLIVRKNVTGTHPKVNISADEGRVQSRARQMELLGNVVATTQEQEPTLQLRSEQVVWLLDKELVKSDRPVEIDRFSCANPQDGKPEDCPRSDRAKANRGEMNLETKIATLEQAAQLNLQSPPLNVDSESIVWNLPKEKVLSERSLTVLHREKQVVFNGDRGQLDLASKIFYLTGNVSSTMPQRKSDMEADMMTWYLPKDEIEAEGNVVYRQGNPPLQLTGSKAVGQIKNETILFTGGDVVTEVVP
ncbi:MAG: LPS export ABC transporter periplasmic protein LptC [Oscillatoria sp. SIO1A7]|nr:LPS export ABC transporter periplasmic protein LptC [Oscillatoria sp. SIO1A7]